jgi:outer membrane protein assembly factor BamB
MVLNSAHLAALTVTTSTLMWVCPAAAQDVLYQSVGSAPAHLIGQHVAGLGDVNGDGIGDFAYSTDEPDVHVVAVSGATGQPLWKTKITLGFWGFQVQALAACGDVDGDGVNDVVAGSPDSFNGGAVAVLSGRTGKVLWWRWSGIATIATGRPSLALET